MPFPLAGNGVRWPPPTFGPSLFPKSGFDTSVRSACVGATVLTLDRLKHGSLCAVRTTLYALRVWTTGG
eukprot:6749481-Prymnesium_polylepis.1